MDLTDIVLGFSGGVDSAAAALRLKAAGRRVRGLFLEVGVAGAREDAERTAEFLKLPLVQIDARDALEKNVCRPFLEGYLEGRTVNPCLICNPTVKLKILSDYADEIGAPFIATGHYALAENGALYEGARENDQSYQLALITRGQLSRLILPLGGDKKTLIREEAGSAGIPIANKPDSMDICFIPDRDYAKWLESRVTPPKPGLAYFKGEIVGEHRGIHRYTVGQRWDETLNGRRLYVTGIIPAEDKIVLSLWEDTFNCEIDVANINWLIDPPSSPFRARGRARHTRWEEPPCTVTPTPRGLHILCDEPLRAPARGQTAAVYINRRVVCAGEIL